jgi:hypothetical protein
VYLVETGRFAIEPTCVLQLPLKEGDTWEHENKPQPGVSVQAQKVTVGKVEEVEVPAGTFRAVRIEVVITSRNGRQLEPPERYTTWHARDVGLVKTTLNGVAIRSLKSFSPGKR